MQPFFMRLGRTTSSGRWIPEVDGLRFVAIFAVFVYHLDQQLQFKADRTLSIHAWYAPLLTLVSNGSRGVELFFVISGFVLGLPFARHALLGERSVSLAHYYLRRLTRLEPPYLVNLLVLSIAILIYEHAAVPVIARHFAATATYLHEAIYKRVSTINGVTWTLEIEVQFYLALPLLALLYRVRRPFLRRGSLVAAIAMLLASDQFAATRGFWGSPGAWIYNSIFFYLQYFLLGLLLVDIYLVLLPRWKTSIAWDAASLCCWMIYFDESWSWDSYLLPVLLFIIFIGAFRGIWLRRLLSSKPIALIGGMCYSIYLWHLFLIAILFKATKHILFGNDHLANLFLQCCLLMPPILWLSGILFVFVERPCMNPDWPRKLAGKIKAAAR